MCVLQVRKAAVESLERLTFKGEQRVVDCFSRCLRDEHAEVICALNPTSNPTILEVAHAEAWRTEEPDV